MTVQPAPSTALASPPALAFDVYGLPAPQGSKRHVGRGILIDTNPEALHTWRDDVKLAAVRALTDNPEWDRNATCVLGRFVFTMPRPRYHYRTGANAHLLRDNAPAYHHTRPDLDKLLRSTWDALDAAGVYVDDSRVVEVFAVKMFTATHPPHGDMVVGPLDRPGVRISLRAAS